MAAEELFVTCACGARLSVAMGMAGSTITCHCGRVNTVPSLSELRQQSGQDPYDETRVFGVLSGSSEDVKAVAKYQKGLILCILVELLCVICQCLLMTLWPPDMRLSLLLGFVVLVASIAGAMFVFLAATKLYGEGVGISLGILTLIGCIGLITMLIVNGKASSVLRQNGYHVGLFGVSLAELG